MASKTILNLEYFAKKRPDVPLRYQRKPPRLNQLKRNPCKMLWLSLLECYAKNEFSKSKCISEIYAHEMCRKNKVVEQRVSLASSKYNFRRVLKYAEKHLD
eukprot:TRINITY_DN441_c0_g1_i2.p1 TRINITY_DN441_c0_g1~~TRINITY_DN441_c0_g1_i2.p1  ORF type:complete len:115 (+),score=10.12 TRINITY_DN441_c0_g1_i2:44-346(+)